MFMQLCVNECVLVCEGISMSLCECESVVVLVKLWA